jgi:hypothetical protein
LTNAGPFYRNHLPVLPWPASQDFWGRFSYSLEVIARELQSEIRICLQVALRLIDGYICIPFPFERRFELNRFIIFTDSIFCIVASHEMPASLTTYETATYN